MMALAARVVRGFRRRFRISAKSAQSTGSTQSGRKKSSGFRPAGIGKSSKGGGGALAPSISFFLSFFLTLDVDVDVDGCNVRSTGVEAISLFSFDCASRLAADARPASL